MRIFACLAVALAIGALAAPADADPFVWTNQDVTFTLDITDLGGTVTAQLKVDRTLDSDTDLLAGVSVKIFSNDPPAAAGTLVSVNPANANWEGSAGSVGGQDGLFSTAVVPGYDTLPSGDGFYSAVYAALGGTNDAITTFNFSWTTNIDPLATGPSIKAITVDGTSDVLGQPGGVLLGQVDVKSRQWSSGPLGDDPVPEPGTFVLVALGAAGYVVARRRKRS